MARKPRIHMPNGFYYITLRGNGDKNIFLSVGDSKYFEDLIAENIIKHGCKVHAYCWMKNQAYLLVQIGNKTLSKFIHNILFRYTIYFNKNHNQDGHLFNGRYKAWLIDPENYLLQIVKNIHLMPYRAGIVSKPHEYKWSSHRAYIGRANSGWLTRDYVFALFSDDDNEASDLYYEYINKDINSGSIDILQDNYTTTDTRIIGDDEFISRVRSYDDQDLRKVKLDRIITEVCKRFDVDLRDITSKSRARRLSNIRTIIGYLVMEYGDKTLSDFCRMVERDVSTLSGAISKYRMQLKNNKNDQQLITELEESLGV